QARVALRIGKMLVDIDPGTLMSESWLPFSLGPKGTALLPANAMRGHQVVIDYGERTLTLARPGTLKVAGVPLPIRINATTGLMAVNGPIDEKSCRGRPDCLSAVSRRAGRKINSCARPWSIGLHNSQTP